MCNICTGTISAEKLDMKGCVNMSTIIKTDNEIRMEILNEENESAIIMTEKGIEIIGGSIIQL